MTFKWTIVFLLYCARYILDYFPLRTLYEYVAVREMSVYKCYFALLLAFQHVFSHFVSVFFNVILTKRWHLLLKY